MNLEPLLTASAVITTHTINRVANIKFKRLASVTPLSLANLLTLPKDILNLRSSSIFLEDANLWDLGGFLVVFPSCLTFL